MKSGRHHYDESGGRASTYVSELHLLFPFRARVDSMSANFPPRLETLEWTIGIG